MIGEIVIKGYTIERDYANISRLSNKDGTNRIKPIIKGRIYFQPRDNKKSIRCLGKQALIWNRKNRKGREILIPKKSTKKREDMNRQAEYSARKKNANEIPEYSVINPDTRSDSDSAKSKGALLSSITAEMMNSIPIGSRGTNRGMLL